MVHTKHLWRAILSIVFVIVLYVVGRVLIVQFLYPTFGEYGPYRGEALREEIALEVRHGSGQSSCGPCHRDKVADFQEKAHASINCETCHAPLITHVQFDDVEIFLTNPDNFKRTGQMEIQQARDLCIRCHESQPAKPEDFPQVDIVDHLKEMEVENSADVCLGCHDPHAPSI